MWNDVKKDGNNGGDKKEIKYASCKSGANGAPLTHQYRVLDEQPYSRGVHWIQAANAGKGLSVDCIKKDCPACAKMKALKASGNAGRNLTWRKMHAINVLDRATNEVQMLDKGNSLFEALVGLLEEVGDLRNYDVKIRVSGEGTDTTFTPIPMPPKPLTPDEKALEKYNFDEIFIKVTPDQMQQLLDGAGWADVLGDNATDSNSDSGTDDNANLDVDFNSGK